ncbi:MAG: hypothetical protein AAB116_24110 [Candidatus Poribacteria bacterium]
MYIHKSEQDWIELGKKRIKSILSKYGVCTTKQLEAKISEAGPYNQRVLPHLITEGLRNLTTIGDIKILPAPSSEIGNLYALSSFKLTNPINKERYEKVVSLNQKWVKLAKSQRICGNVLEEIIHKAILESKTMLCPGSPQKPVCEINGFQIIDNSPLDFTLYDKSTSLRIGVEVKNIREWIYPSAEEVWRLIGRCVSIKAVPVLIARKISYVARSELFQRIGLICHETYNQYFDISVESQLEDIKHKNGLGFKDIKTVDTSLPINEFVESRHIKFFRESLPPLLQKGYHQTFFDNLSLLEKFAISKSMYKTNMDSPERQKLYREFKNIITI